MKGNKVFLLVGSTDVSYVVGNGKEGSLELKLVVGDVANSTGSEPRERIKWGEPKPLLSLITPAASKSKLAEFSPSGGSGVLMEDGTLVFPLMAMNKNQMKLFTRLSIRRMTAKTGCSQRVCLLPTALTPASPNGRENFS
ncbi:trans-sialidase [Trypanosoma cruzi Dm28c]|uniref:Trans-sialidase n=1 Tax=Trypanosoma cruzi Dm28c TaxID=1416333 RepID=V5ALU5_TRYCR|nr:trans-sialidase [Trypanosoma cruzi Dm28c]